MEHVLPKDRSRSCIDWKRQNDIISVDWPSQSPDANSTENVLATHLKKRARNEKSTRKI